MKSTVWRGVWSGIGAGWLLFLLLAAFAYLTPARLQFARFAGRDHAVLLAEHTLRLQTLEAAQSARDPASAYDGARAAVAESEKRIAAWRRVNSGISAFGFLGWVLDLWPWLLGLALALPVLGGLIGAQAGQPDVWSQHAARAAPSPAPGTSADAVPRVSEPGAISPVSSVPAAQAEPAQPADWNWNAQPAVRNAPARPKSPPVKSPHGPDAD